MKKFPEKLKQKLENRISKDAFRQLVTQNNLVDFSSNDYLGFSKSEHIFNKTHEFLIGHDIIKNGSTGSRLLSGNHHVYSIVEEMLCNFHSTEAAIIYNSGYDANIGFFSSVPQRGDVILYDEYSHASIRDGISMSHAKSYKFKHNDLESLKQLIIRHSKYTSAPHQNTYVVTESVFSMDGDSPDLIKICDICNKQNAYLIVDEAHAIGVFGSHGEGLIQSLKQEKKIFARIVTYGKALGCHGAAILGCSILKQYLVNYSRSFIYTTALPPHSLATIHEAYSYLLNSKNKDKLHKNIQHFKSEILKNNLASMFITSQSAIQCCIISGNEKVKSIAKKLQEHYFDVKPIMSPTVPHNQERLRFCIHAYNTTQEISEVLQLLATFVL